MPVDDDSRIARKVQRGDKAAFEILVDKYQRPIFSFIYHFFREYSICEDLTQETFLRAFRFIKTYKTKQKFSTWLFAIAKNLSVDEMRRRGRAPSVSTELVSEIQLVNPGKDGESNPEDMLAESDSSRYLRELIGELPEKYKTALILFYFNELSYEEISQVMGISMANTKIVLFRAKKKLSEMYKSKANNGQR